MHTMTTTQTRPTIPAASPSKVTAAQRASRQEVRRGLTTLRPALYARALKLSRSPSLADDIVQDTMVRALRFATQYRAGTNLKAWIFQVLMSVFLTQCRRNKRERRALDNLTKDPCAWVKHDAPTVMRSLSARPARALANLPDSYRSAVQLVDIQGLSYREAATRLGVPVGTIMSRLHRGRKILAAELQDPRTALPAAPQCPPLAA
jgi:RNA polymerase sigma-70 factor (ECF subfamily)